MAKKYKENQEELSFFFFMVTDYFRLFHSIIVLPSPQKSWNLMRRWHCMVSVKWPKTNYPQTRATAIKL